jgi:hypothetical protein
MSDLIISSPDQNVTITAGSPQTLITTPDKSVILRGGGLPGPTGPQGPQGVQGPPGDDAEWTRMTQVEYDNLLVKDPNTLYVIVG